MHRAPDIQHPPDQTVTLEGGRTLGYIDIGDPGGTPIISCHGGLSSRLDVVPADAAAKEGGVRLIAADRPGIGTSDPNPDATIVSWGDDMRQLADSLGLDRFAVMGWSYGGAFAQAVAWGNPERVRTLSLIASVIPMAWPNAREELNKMDQRFQKWSEHAVGGAAERTIFHLMHGGAHRWPKAWAEKSGYDGDAAEALGTAIAEGLTHAKGTQAEYRLLDGDWGFDPSEIAVPTHVWQGDADELVPSGWGHRLADAIPGATLHEVAGGNHFLWYDHWDEIFATATSS